MGKRPIPPDDCGRASAIPIPSKVLAKMTATLSGRMTLRFFALACGMENHHPTRRTWAAFQRKLAQESVEVALAVHHARFAQAWIIKANALPRIDVTPELLSRLRNAFPEPRTLVLDGSVAPFPESVAVLAIPSEGGGARVYTIYAIDESFPDSVLALAAVRVGAKLEIRLLKQNGWRP